jgi:DNA-binding transcriptional LysR family regulator
VTGRPLPSVDSLRCFVAAAQHLNFRRAATEVALTPAALSQRIKQLEDMLGCVLFERSPQHVALTPAGQALLERAKPALDAVRACAEVADATPSRVRVTVATRFELGMSWLLPALVDLRRERPQLHVDLVFGSSGEVLARLEQGSVDATVTSAPLANAEWAAEVLHPEAYVLVASPQLLAERPFDRVEHAARHTILDIDGDLPLARYALSACPGLGFGDVWRCGTGGAVVALARAGQGVAVVPLYMVRGDLDAGGLVRLLPELELLSDTFRLIYRSTSPAIDTLKELASWLRQRPLV